MAEIPKCDVHLGVTMRFDPVRRTHKHLRRKGPTMNDISDYAVLKARTGIYRCTVPGCPRVSLNEDCKGKIFNGTASRKWR